MRNQGKSEWRMPSVEAAAVSVVLLGLYFYWFGVADRYAVFLYGHTAIQQVAAAPFDAITASRYWMTGFVAAGFVMVWRSRVSDARARKRPLYAKSNREIAGKRSAGVVRPSSIMPL